MMHAGQEAACPTPRLMHDAPPMQASCSLLYCCRDGLTEAELELLLLHEADGSAGAAWWPTLAAHLAILTMMPRPAGARLRLVHEQAVQAVAVRYMPSPASPEPWHLQLATFFEAHP